MLFGRSSRFARVCGAVVGLSVLVGLTGDCSGGGKHRQTKPSPSSTSSASASAARISRLLTIGSVNVQAAGKSVALSRATRLAVLAIAQNYVDAAIMAPLETGKVGRGYGALFVAGIRPAAIGPDAPVLTDVVIGRTTKLSERSSPVAISALADTSGALLYVSTNFHVVVHATKTSGEITVDRKVELTYEQVGRAWRVVAYRVEVTRHAPARATPRRPSRRTTTTRPSRRRTTTTARASRS